MIDIAGLDKAAVLAALYNRSKPQGMGRWVPGAEQPMTVEQARGYPLEADYINGRVMKVNLTGDSFDEWLYDRDNGEGAAAQAVDSVRQAQRG